ncbi:MAG: class I SAM-dependent methyltransferase [Myxococcota bacterium]
MSDDYLTHNRDHWNKATEAHYTSDFYDVDAWLAGEQSLREPELHMLPADLTGKRLLHLQCHFGMDTLSLARRGAEVTGVDLSDRAIARATELAKRAELAGRFVCSDVYEAPNTLAEPESFDVVFSSFGAIGWLPDLDRWAEVITHYLAPGGAFVFAEFHPVVWMLDDKHEFFEYSYFKRDAIVEQNTGSYTDGSEKLTSTEISWNHALDEVITALLDKGLTLEAFREYDYSPWNCFQDTVEVGKNRYQFKGKEGMLPLCYALRARK